MSSSHRRLIRREVLAAFPRPSLVRLLAPHAAALAERGVAVDALAGDDGTLGSPAFVALYTLLTRGDRGLPADLRDELADLDALATTAGQAALADACEHAGLPPPRGETPASAALRLLLDARDVFREARVRVACSGSTRLALLSGEPLSRAPDAEALARAVAASFAPWLEAHDRSSYVDALAVESDDEILLEVLHGMPLRTQVELTAELAPRVRSTRPVRRDYVVVAWRTGRIGMSCCSLAEREQLRAALGAALVGTPDAFAPRPLLSLDALLAGPPAPLPGVHAIRIERLEVRGADGASTVLHRRPDVHARLADPAVRAALDGRVVAATLGFSIEGRPRPLSVELSLPSSVALDRRSSDVEALVRGVLEERGLLARPPRHARVLAALRRSCAGGREGGREPKRERARRRSAWARGRARGREAERVGEGPSAWARGEGVGEGPSAWARGRAPGRGPSAWARGRARTCASEH